MKRTALLLIFMFATSLAFAQKEKLKGSRNVTITQKEIGEFENLEVEDNIEVFLTQSSKSELEIEADDNLHDAFNISVNNGTLRISTSKDINSAKKISVKVGYTNGFRMVIAKDDSRVTGLTDIKIDNFTIKASGSAKVFATVKSKTFTLMANDKAKTELNVASDNTMVELSKNSQLKALISSTKIKFDMYQKSLATIEGDANDLKLRADGNTNFTGKNLSTKNAEIYAEGYANVSIAVSGNASIEASGKSEIVLHGDQGKIEIRKFTDNASIQKKPLK